VKLTLPPCICQIEREGERWSHGGAAATVGGPAYRRPAIVVPAGVAPHQGRERDAGEEGIPRCAMERERERKGRWGQGRER